MTLLKTIARYGAPRPVHALRPDGRPLCGAHLKHVKEIDGDPGDVTCGSCLARREKAAIWDRKKRLEGARRERYEVGTSQDCRVVHAVAFCPETGRDVRRV